MNKYMKEDHNVNKYANLLMFIALAIGIIANYYYVSTSHSPFNFMNIGLMILTMLVNLELSRQFKENYFLIALWIIATYFFGAIIAIIHYVVVRTFLFLKDNKKLI